MSEKGVVGIRRAYHRAMSRIGTFPDDDLAGWIEKSPELGGAIGAFSDAVYNRSRLPMRTRDLALSCALWVGMGRVLRTLDIAQSCNLTRPSRV